MEEITKLFELCNQFGMPVEIHDVYGGVQVTLYNEDGNYLDDAVCRIGSHGFEKGLLETYVLSDCDGYETAQEVLMGWADMYFFGIMPDHEEDDWDDYE